ncbi:MAG: phage major capsid protein [Sphingomonadaceae bacterium]
MTDFVEIKDLLDRQSEAFEAFKSDFSERLAGESKARTDLEKRLGRPGFEPQHSEAAATTEMKAIGNFVRSGAADWSQDAELKAMSVGSDPDGGYLVTPYLSQSMTTRLRDMSPMRQLARVETMTTGDAFEEPDDRDEVGASWVGETESRSDTDTPQLGMIRIPLDEIFAQPKATQRLLDDTNRDLGAWLESKLTDKFGRSEGEAFVTGNGIKKPRGLLSYTATTEADTVRAAGKLQYVPTGAASAFPTSAPGDVLKTLMWTLRTPYRTGAVWTMNSNTASVVDKFKNGSGDYIWRDGMLAGSPPSLLGYPVYLDEEMPDIGAGEFPIAFGNFKLGYIIVDRPGIKLLRDPYTDKPHVKFYGYRRVGGGLANDDAIKLLKVAAS